MISQYRLLKDGTRIVSIDLIKQVAGIDGIYSAVFPILCMAGQFKLL